MLGTVKLLHSALPEQRRFDGLRRCVSAAQCRMCIEHLCRLSTADAYRLLEQDARTESVGTAIAALTVDELIGASQQRKRAIARDIEHVQVPGSRACPAASYVPSAIPKRKNPPQGWVLSTA